MEWQLYNCTTIPKKDHSGLTTKPIPVIDIFSGPGGLAEGFAGCRDENQRSRYRVVLSVESDKAAVRTLRLRAFLRTFPDFPKNLPVEYYDFLNGALGEQPDWHELYRDNWEQACDEVMHCALGNSETEDRFRRKILDLRARYGDRTVLVGGPPCQAYSLVGRARVAGIQKHTFELVCQRRSVGLKTTSDTLDITNKQRVASRGVEKVGLSEEQIYHAEKEYRERDRSGGSVKNYPDHIYRRQRTYPLLIVHLLAIETDDCTPEPREPVTAWSMSFPMTNREEEKTEYVVNSRWFEENYGISGVEDEVEGDEYY